MSDRANHWEDRYLGTPVDGVGWYRPRLDASLQLIDSLCVNGSCRIIDVGGGASTLVDDLLERELSRITVLDLSPAALSIARKRLGADASRVEWIIGDILEVDLGIDRYDLWHDRAVFHFLTEPRERLIYLEQLRSVLEPGGHVVIATFGPDAPALCSGLPVQRYRHTELAATFGPSFRLLVTREEEHRTPGGTEQPYVYWLFEYRDRA